MMQNLCMNRASSSQAQAMTTLHVRTNVNDVACCVPITKHFGLALLPNWGHSLPPPSAAVPIHVRPLLWKETEKLRRFSAGPFESGGPPNLSTTPLTKQRGGEEGRDWSRVPREEGWCQGAQV